jgi:predicted TIM-barrel fold metal-dependent hydrolase
MTTPHQRDSAALHARLGHPVVDADGHYLELMPVMLDYLEQVGGQRVVEGFKLFGSRVTRSLTSSLEERRKHRVAMEAFWAVPSKNTLDRATAMLPKLLYERLDEFGLDFTVLYPTSGLGLPFIPDEEVRRATCRAFNMFVADQYRPFSDRITPAAVIPMHTPAEAIDELEYAMKTLGLKAVMMQNPVLRRFEEGEGGHRPFWLDFLGIDSAHDYDPVWRKCVALGVSPSLHGGSRGMGMRVSPSNFVFNHIGHFAATAEATCKSLFLGGVTRRFPTLKIAFLEGGVGWACGLYSDLIGHWKKRNLKALDEVNPANLDRKLLGELIERYAGHEAADRLAQSMQPAAEGGAGTGGLRNLDDFAACGISRAEDIRELFATNFYFGCEADDPMNAWAFNRKTNPYGARLNTLLGSDIGHFDVVDMKQVLLEAHELVDDELITPDDFREFVFANPVRFWGEANPDFFKGTVVEKQAREMLSKGMQPAA